MINGDFKVQFRSEKLTANGLDLSLKAAFPLEGVKLSIVDSQEQSAQPLDMQPTDSTGQHWAISVAKPTSAESWLRVAIQSEGTLYYGETQTAFVKYETLFTE